MHANKYAVFLIISIFVSPALADDCTFYAKTGAKVSPRSGECMIDGKPSEGVEIKSGLERCMHREDKGVLSEILWKNGKRNGPAFYHDYNDRRIVATFKDDFADGPAQVFSKDNKLLCEMKFAEGKMQGAVRELYPSGKLKAARAIVGEREGDGHIELFENGKLTTLRCAKQSIVPEDIAPCGFDGKVSRVQLHGHDGKPIRNVSFWQNGKLTKLETVDRQGLAMTRTYPPPGEDDTYDTEILHKNGKVFRTYRTQKNRLQGPYREYSEEGTLLLQTVYQGDAKHSEERYYMNGKLKRSVNNTGDGALLAAQEFWDNGKIKSEGTYSVSQWPEATRHQSGSWDYLLEEGRVKRFSKDGQLSEERSYRAGRLDGEQKLYFVNGKLAVEQVFANDAIRKMKCYDPSGKLELSEEYFADGSRKSGAPELSEKEQQEKGVCRVDR